MEARSHRLSSPASDRRLHGGRVLHAALLAVALLALAATILLGGRGANEPTLARATEPGATPAFVPTGFGAGYDRAVARLVVANHALEQRQARLSDAIRAGAERAAVDELRRGVAALEREYTRAVRAVSAGR